LYESVKYPNWFIAINKKGRVVAGPNSTRGKRSRLFMPRSKKEYPKNIGRGRAAVERARESLRRRKMKKLKKRLRMHRKQRRTIEQWLS
jgi:hypothetical protein